MGDLQPVAFDIETSGFEKEAVITVVGLAHELGEVLILNTAGRTVNGASLERSLEASSAGRVTLQCVSSEAELLTNLHDVAEDRIDSNRHYLTAYHGETWNGGFDLPFVRTACVTHNVDWPFSDLAYADVFTIVDRFNTQEKNDLVGVYEELIGGESCDPFDDSGSAVDAFENADWEPLLLHNLADIQRTRELAALAGEYVPQSDFKMKSLTPPKN